VVIKNNKIVGIGKQESHSKKDASSHVEIVAMRNASKKLGTIYLNDCVLYSTNEPCCMCIGMAIWCRIKGIVYGSFIKDLMIYWRKNGNNQNLVDCKSLLRKYGSECFVIGNFMKNDCCKLFCLDKKIK
jgi:tRNA(Arg) A34 adenosine deaminase TadA